MTNNRSAAKPAVVADERREAIRSLYMESLQLVERLHRRLLDVIGDGEHRGARYRMAPRASPRGPVREISVPPRHRAHVFAGPRVQIAHDPR